MLQWYKFNKFSGLFTWGKSTAYYIPPVSYRVRLFSFLDRHKSYWEPWNLISGREIVDSLFGLWRIYCGQAERFVAIWGISANVERTRCFNNPPSARVKTGDMQLTWFLTSLGLKSSYDHSYDDFQAIKRYLIKRYFQVASWFCAVFFILILQLEIWAGQVIWLQRGNHVRVSVLNR